MTSTLRRRCARAPSALRGRLLALLLAAVLPLLAAGLLAAPAQAARWVWPLSGTQEVARPFAPGPERWDPGHRGADLPGEPGQPVRAAGAGRVSYAGLLAGRGVVVVVHGALRTTYEPVSASVAVGQPVAAGEALGTLEPGHAGCPVAACLHWGLLRGETYLDPVRLVRGGPVRLLPREPPLPEVRAGAPAAALLPLLPPGAPDTAPLPQAPAGLLPRDGPPSAPAPPPAAAQRVPGRTDPGAPGPLAGAAGLVLLAALVARRW